MSIPSDRWLTLAGAARAAHCARASLMAAIHRGDLPAYCDRCHRRLSLVALKRGHLCPLPANGVRFRLALRWREVVRYSVSPTHHAAGLASAKARAKKRRPRVA